MTSNELFSVVMQHRELMELLEVIADLPLPDCWLAAGTIRNLIWNHLADRETILETDLDVVFFAPEWSETETQRLEKWLQSTYPSYCWELKNQADMHRHSPNTAPYQCTSDAISKYPERCTAIAVRYIHGKLELLAPYGLTDIANFVVRPTPHFLADPLRMKVYWERLAKKNWQQQWPQLQVLPE